MKLLLATDFSACSSAAVEAVLTQFPPNGTEVRLLHAVDWEQQLPASYLFAEGRDAAKDLLGEKDRIMRDIQSHMVDVERRLTAAGFVATTQLETGESPHRVILNTARAWPADLIVMGSHGRAGLARWLLGSVAEGVMRHAPCSVQVVRPSAESQGE